MCRARPGKPWWVAWQEVWLLGLLGLPRGSKIYVVNPEGEGNRDTCSNDFKAKFQDASKFATEAQRDAVCFDPCFELADDERATTIMDWERRQFVRVAALNGLQIVHSVEGEDEGALPGWYK